MSELVFEIQVAPISTWCVVRRYRGSQACADAIEDAQSLPSTTPVRVVQIESLRQKEVWLNETAQVKAGKRKR